MNKKIFNPVQINKIFAGFLIILSAFFIVLAILSLQDGLNFRKVCKNEPIWQYNESGKMKFDISDLFLISHCPFKYEENPINSKQEYITEKDWKIGFINAEMGFFNYAFALCLLYLASFFFSPFLNKRYADLFKDTFQWMIIFLILLYCGLYFAKFVWGLY